MRKVVYEEEEEMKNLVIHPYDKSTDFLKPIYGNVKNPIVISKDSSPEQIDDLLKTSDRVMMMGHGYPRGLFSMGLFNIRRIASAKTRLKWDAINITDADMLRGQTENVYIWCHADKFVEENDLHGFYSGMFVSEVGEAMYCGLGEVTQEMVNESNNMFSEIVGRYIDLPKEELYEKVMEEYGLLAETNPVAKYNHERLYIR
jgi:hypothetical protein